MSSRKMKFKSVFLCMATASLAMLLLTVALEKEAGAVSFFNDPLAKYAGEAGRQNKIENLRTQPAAQQKSRAPEPTTLILFLSGMIGALSRFARTSFEKFKRMSDIILSLIGLTAALPVIMLIALLIKLTSKGPVIYKQDRIGKGGEIFKIYKLRTMLADAEKMTGAVWARNNDSRVTPIGRILRKTHVDEIPQLLNVLKGQMSIVGPRPERPELVRDLKTLVLDYEKRLQIEPGITGLAQVWHKYDETIDDVKKKIKYDLLYIRNIRFLTDLWIVARTFTVVLTGRNRH